MPFPYTRVKDIRKVRYVEKPGLLGEPVFYAQYRTGLFGWETICTWTDVPIGESSLQAIKDFIARTVEYNNKPKSRPKPKYHY